MPRASRAASLDSGSPLPFEKRTRAGTGSPWKWAARQSCAGLGARREGALAPGALGVQRAPVRVRPVDGVRRLDELLVEVAVARHRAHRIRRRPAGQRIASPGMELGISGRTALVMGASRGIGRAIAAALAREGARVAMASRSREQLEQAAAEIEGETAVFAADTSDLDRLAALPGEVEEALGPVEILVANTGGPPLGGALDHPLEEWEQAYRSLVLAPRVLIEAVLPGDARARLGTDRQRRLDLGARADSRAGALQLAPDGGGWLLQDAGRRGRRRGDHRQHGRHGSLRHRPAGRQLGLVGGDGAPRSRGCPGRHAWGSPRSTATWSPSCARSGPPT